MAISITINLVERKVGSLTSNSLFFPLLVPLATLQMCKGGLSFYCFAFFNSQQAFNSVEKIATRKAVRSFITLELLDSVFKKKDRSRVPERKWKYSKFDVFIFNHIHLYAFIYNYMCQWESTMSCILCTCVCLYIDVHAFICPCVCSIGSVFVSACICLYGFKPKDHRNTNVDPDVMCR